ncbi:MAG: IS630 family transposase, partial [Alphaproteobacteria bacterium]|nr:IS630 family transposase [Alphaproteobacteria bacterium]
RRGVFRSLVDLQAAINRYLGEHNRKPKPFLWTADPNRIIEKINRGHQVWRQTTSSVLIGSRTAQSLK